MDETEYLVAHPSRFTSGKDLSPQCGYKGKEKISVPTGNLKYTLYTVVQKSLDTVCLTTGRQCQITFAPPCTVVRQKLAYFHTVVVKKSGFETDKCSRSRL
jgi:hypothetical protein